MKYFYILILFIFTLHTNVSANPSSGNITHYNSPGNLEVSNLLNCIDLNQVKKTFSAADLFNAVPKCTADKSYVKAAKLFAIAGTFATFDKIRVKDRTAHQAHTILSRNAVGSMNKDDRDAFVAEITKITDVGSSEQRSLCKEVSKIGPPNYHPRYMIQHGMGAFSKNKNKSDFVENFEKDKAWKDALLKYLKCSK